MCIDKNIIGFTSVGTQHFLPVGAGITFCGCVSAVKLNIGKRFVLPSFGKQIGGQTEPVVDADNLYFVVK